MKQTICDRCKDIIKDSSIDIKNSYIVFSSSKNEYLDLCTNCREALENFLLSSEVAVAGR